MCLVFVFVSEFLSTCMASQPMIYFSVKVQKISTSGVILHYLNLFKDGYNYIVVTWLLCLVDISISLFYSVFAHLFVSSEKWFLCLTFYFDYKKKYFWKPITQLFISTVYMNVISLMRKYNSLNGTSLKWTAFQ